MTKPSSNTTSAQATVPLSKLCELYSRLFSEADYYYDPSTDVVFSNVFNVGTPLAGSKRQNNMVVYSLTTKTGTRTSVHHTAIAGYWKKYSAEQKAATTNKPVSLAEQFEALGYVDIATLPIECAAVPLRNSWTFSDGTFKFPVVAKRYYWDPVNRELHSTNTGWKLGCTPLSKGGYYPSLSLHHEARKDPSFKSIALAVRSVAIDAAYKRNKAAKPTVQPTQTAEVFQSVNIDVSEMNFKGLVRFANQAISGRGVTKPGSYYYTPTTRLLTTHAGRVLKGSAPKLTTSGVVSYHHCAMSDGYRKIMGSASIQLRSDVLYQAAMRWVNDRNVANGASAVATTTTAQPQAKLNLAPPTEPKYLVACGGIVITPAPVNKDDAKKQVIELASVKQDYHTIRVLQVVQTVKPGARVEFDF